MKVATAIGQPHAALLDQHHHAVVVATTLVSDARSKIVSSVIGSGDGTQRAVAERLLIDDAIAAADQHDGARQAFLRAIASSTSGSISVELRDVEAGGCRRPLLTRRGGRRARHADRTRATAAVVNLARRYVMG